MNKKLYIPLFVTLAIATAVIPVSFVSAESPTVAPVASEQLSADEAEALQQANAYIEQGQGNLDKGILLLEGLVTDGTKAAVVYQKLGDLYLQAGQNPRKAEAAYMKAIDLATAAKNVKGQAEAQVALAKVKMMLGKTDEAKSLLNLAKATYQSLGESKHASELQKQIVAITSDANNAGNLPRPVFRSLDLCPPLCND